MRNLIHRLSFETRGTSLIELAIVAPVLAGLLLGMVDGSLLVQRRIELQEVAAQLANIAASKAPTTSTITDLTAVASSMAGIPQNQVTLTLGIRCNNGSIKALDATCNAGEQHSTIMTIRLQDEFGPDSGSVGFLHDISLDVSREVQVA